MKEAVRQDEGAGCCAKWRPGGLMGSVSVRGVAIGAVVAVVISAGTAVATTMAFTLGATNRVDAASKVTNVKTDGTLNTVNGALITLENKTTGTAATALGLSVASGRPPLTVNSGTKVTNLNADTLDGIDSTGFIKGSGTTYTSAQAIPFGQSSSPVVVPGFFNVKYECPSNGTSSGQIDVLNLVTGQALNLFGHNALYPDTFYDQPGPGGTDNLGTQDRGASGAIPGDSTTLSIQAVLNGLQTVATVEIASVVRSNDCHFQLQIFVTHP